MPKNRDYSEKNIYIFNNLNPLDYFFWGMLKVYLLKIRNKPSRHCITDVYAGTDGNISTPDIQCSFAECSKILLMRGTTLNIPCIVLYCIVLE